MFQLLIEADELEEVSTHHFSPSDDTRHQFDLRICSRFVSFCAGGGDFFAPFFRDPFFRGDVDVFPFGGRDPFRGVWRDFDRALQDFAPATTAAAEFDWHPSVDIAETKENFTVSASLPGVPKENVKIDVEGDTLTLRGEKKDEKVEEDKEKKFIKRESHYGTFQRSFTLPDNVDKKNIKASFKDGVLHVNIPKAAATEAQTITIE